MEVFLHADAWIALLTLTFLEIILGIDNIIFISITAGKLPKDQIKKATRLGLLLALIFRILLLMGVSWLISMKAPFLSFDLTWFKAGITGQSVILILGGIFLLYKSTKEIHHKVEGIDEQDTITTKSKVSTTLGKVIFQIVPLPSFGNQYYLLLRLSHLILLQRESIHSYYTFQLMHCYVLAAL